uniref:DNA polymerase delta subunit 4 n=1 Tax=Eptatretus burgeri TaxID=7764 RepID=A0A8C4N1X1_EPTBU
MPQNRLITDTLPAVKTTESISKPSLDVQGGVTESELQVLHTFDLNYEFGPCLGISRMQRWDRAVHLGLTPPQHIHALLEYYPSDPQVQQWWVARTC